MTVKNMHTSSYLTYFIEKLKSVFKIKIVKTIIQSDGPERVALCENAAKLFLLTCKCLFLKKNYTPTLHIDLSRTNHNILRLLLYIISSIVYS